MSFDPFTQMKSQFWNKWFVEDIPALDNLSPIDAAKTAQGRRKLDELLALYDSFRDGSSSMGSIDTNIPTKYAKWKLGYGEGSASEFAEEEAILNFQDSNPKRSTQRKERHTTRLEKKKAAIWIPRRCEVPGCSKCGEDVKACSRCQCAYYCGRDHQKEDWDRHKLDCNAIRKCGDFLQARAFLPSKELEKYPMNCFPLEKSQDDATPKCFVCHSNSSEVDITYTECCNLPICDNYHEYEIMSYSRDFCGRSHYHYTACATHMHEGHDGDWRDCSECNRERDGARSFHSTNGFCATPCLEKFMPQGSMITFGCDVKGCKNRIIPGHNGVKYCPGGQKHCESCPGR